MPHAEIPAALKTAKFWQRVTIGCGCWLWQGNISAGYGQVSYRGKTYRAHRIAFEIVFGPIEEGLQLDHLCRNRRCVNPYHLDAVTGRQNVLRSPVAPTSINAKRTHCAHGHELSGKNLRLRPTGGRACVQCEALAGKRRYQKHLQKHGSSRGWRK